MYSTCVNNTLFLYRDGVRLHRMRFYIYECTERNDLKSMIQERCGIVVQTKGEHVVCFAAQCLGLEDGEIFSTEYIKQCCETNMLLDLKNFRLGKNPNCFNVDPLEVLKGITSWPKNIRCFTNSNRYNNNEVKDTQDFELTSQKRKRSSIKKNGMEQERRLCHWRQAYSREEDEQIITYLLKNKNYKKAGTNTLWKKMELQEVLRDRSWQSMKNRLRIIRLHIEKYDLCDEDIKKLGGKRAASNSNSLNVSIENSRCCFCCPKMDDCEVANGNHYVRYSCHCSHRMKRQAVASVQNEALVQVQSIGSIQSQAKPSQESCVRKEKPLGVKQCHSNRAESFSCESEALVEVQSIGGTQSQAKQSQESCARKEKPLGVKQCHTNRAESFSCRSEAVVEVQSIGGTQSPAKPSQESCVRKEKLLGVKQCYTNRKESVSCANSAPSGEESVSESEPEYSFKDICSPFHKTYSQFRATNGLQPNHKRKLYIPQSSDINISIKSGDISLLKNNTAQKKYNIPLRWPQIFTPINSTVFEKEVAENDTVAAEELNHETQNQNRCPDDNGSTVYGSCQLHGTENGSTTNSSKSMPSGEGTEALIAVDNPTIVKLTCHSNKPKDTLPNKDQHPLDMRSYSTPKKLFKIFNKRESKSSVIESVYISECTKEKLVKNRMEMEEGIVSPSFTTSDTSSEFGLQVREERSTNHVNEFISDQMSSEYRKLQTGRSNKTHHESHFEITDMLYSDRLQNEESPITQHTAAEDIRSMPEKDLSSSPTHHHEHSNSKQQSSTKSLPGGDSVVYGKEHCQHDSNYKDFYVNQWLNSVMNYYKNGNLSKLSSFSEKLKEVSTSSGQDDLDSKNTSCDNLNEETSHHVTHINKIFCVQSDTSKTGEQGSTESCYGAEESSSIVNNDCVPTNLGKISVLKDRSVCVLGPSERFDHNEMSHTSSYEDSRKSSNIKETRNSNVLRGRISEPSDETSAADSKSDNVCHLQSSTKTITAAKNENHREETFLRLSHVTSLCNQEQCYEESCGSGDIIVESQPSSISNHEPIQLKEKISTQITDEDNLLHDEGSVLESQLSQDSIHIKQEISIDVEDEEFRYEGYSPPVDFLSHTSDNE